MIPVQLWWLRTREKTSWLASNNVGVAVCNDLTKQPAASTNMSDGQMCGFLVFFCGTQEHSRIYPPFRRRGSHLAAPVSVGVPPEMEVVATDPNQAMYTK
jgi:hypothetical protein